MTDAGQLLQQLGFSEYETKAYIALLQQHPANGYHLAKISGVPRANIYGVLQKLEERGAVFSINSSGSTVYSPVAPDELIRRLGNHIGQVLTAAQDALKQVATPVEHHYVENIQGYAQMIGQARDLIHLAQEQLLIALWQPEAQILAESLASAEERHVCIRTLCFQACPKECGGCQGHVYRYRVTPEEHPHWLIVIQDNKQMLMGTTGQDSVAIRTKQPAMITLTTWYIRHSITLAAVLSDMGSKLEEMLQPETHNLLRSVGQGNSWLDTMLHLMRK